MFIHLETISTSVEYSHLEGYGVLFRRGLILLTGRGGVSSFFPVS